MLEETLSPKMIFDDNNNNTEDDGSVFYEEDVQFAMATENKYLPIPALFSS
jgi:hypothetical protein